MKQVYLDYSATTPVKEEVVREMLPFFTERYGNPSRIQILSASEKWTSLASRKRAGSTTA